MDKLGRQHTVREGFIPRVEDITATIGTPEYQPSGAVWYDAFSRTNNGTGVFYVGTDLTENAVNIGKPPLFQVKSVIRYSADKMRRVELRFGPRMVKHIDTSMAIKVMHFNRKTLLHMLLP
ncbi:MAG: hypothetical protein U5J96_17495 [Ignavibacteriaceae bacterium]|nr:hypothetical protein [Ignavibacteriaceae bacterium]